MKVYVLVTNFKALL